jgi:glycosyltransferase involved in cell wall biosynthesis
MMEHLTEFSTLEWLLMGTTAALFVMQALYYLLTYLRPYSRTKAQQNNSQMQHEQPPVSIVVYACNESANLSDNLPALLTQDYPAYEVIVINDGSTDESDDVLKRFENDYPHLYHTFIPQESRYLSRRKLALTIGIKAAKHDVLVFTEAKCRPLTNRWLDAMTRNYTPETAIVLGFCSYQMHKGFFHKLAAYDNLLTGVQYISAALIDRPFSGCGRNLSYLKPLFYEHKGYSRFLNLHAGDDNLFVNEASTATNTRVEYTPDSLTTMSPFDSFAAWREMLASRVATQRYFKGFRLTFYRMERLSSVLFLLAALATCLVGAIVRNPLTAFVGFLLYCLLYVLKSFVWEKLATLLGQRTFAIWLPIIEIVHLSASLYIRLYRLFRHKRDYTFTLSEK